VFQRTSMTLVYLATNIASVLDARVCGVEASKTCAERLGGQYGRYCGLGIWGYGVSFDPFG